MPHKFGTKMTQAQLNELLRLATAKEKDWAALESFLGWNGKSEAEQMAEISGIVDAAAEGQIEVYQAALRSNYVDDALRYRIAGHLRILRGHGDLFNDDASNQKPRPVVTAKSESTLRAMLASETDPARKWELCRQLREARGHGDLFE